MREKGGFGSKVVQELRLIADERNNLQGEDVAIVQARNNQSLC